MTTLYAADICPRAFSKLFWMRVNRVLAWTLVLSPALQWAAGMSFATGFLIDLAILCAHGALSFALFGKPETKSRVFNVAMHGMGLRPRDLSERNRFLLGGYRIAMAAGAIGLCFTPLSLPAFLLCLTWIYPIVRLPITIIAHVWGASIYALRRWGFRRMAEDVAAVIVIAYVLVSVINLIR